MTTPVYNLDGEEGDEIDLPSVFTTEIRKDLIKRAFLAATANAKQPYGSDEYAGLRTSAESPGSGRGMAHVPRANGEAARVPQAVGGRKAHPPKAEKDQSLEVNDKERRQAIRSAIAATGDKVVVSDRGHEFGDDVHLPVVLSNDFEDVVKTQEVVDILENLGIHADIERADSKKSIRSGQGTTRGRKYKRPKSILFVTSSDLGPSKAARNLAGADVATGTEVNIQDLAPGGDPGRLTVWTKRALAEVDER